MKYEIFTENKNKSKVVELTARRFENATFIDTLGVYKGVLENGLVITIVGSPSDRSMIKSLALDIKEVNEQECILVVETAAPYNLI